jgi:hypothetical protein
MPPDDFVQQAAGIPPQDERPSANVKGGRATGIADQA